MRSNGEISAEQKLDRFILGVRIEIENFTDRQLSEIKTIIDKESFDREEDDKRFDELGEIDE